MRTDRKSEGREPEAMEDAARGESADRERERAGGADAAVGGGAGAEAASPDLPERDSTEAELAASRDRYLRLAAEFDNYRKRVERERSEGTVRAQATLVERLLEPLDDLQRVADYTAENSTADALLEGVQMVERKMLRVLESAGLEMIDAKGKPFDPARHEALMTTEAETEEEDESVGEVFQAGYQFKGVLLRPARVQVKKYNG